MWIQSLARIVLLEGCKALGMKTIRVPTRRDYASTIGCMLSVVLTSTALGQAQADIDGLFEAYFEGDSARLTEIMAALDGRVLFELGMAAMDEQELPLAQACFDGVVHANPSDHRARLELARTLFFLGEAGQSETQFKKVLAANPPLEVRKNVRKYLDRIARERILQDPSRPGPHAKKAVSKSSKWLKHIAITTGVARDSNANYGSSKSSIRIQPIQAGPVSFDRLAVGDDSKPIESWSGYVFGSASAIYTMDDLGRKAWVSELEFYKNWLDKAEEFNLFNAALSTGLRVSSATAYLDLPATFSHMQLNGERFLDQWAISPYYIQRLGETSFSICALQLKYREYDDAHRLDGTELAWEQSYRRSYDKGRSRIDFAGGIRYEDTDAPAFENVAMTLRLSGQFGLPGQWVPSASISYIQSRYMGQEALAPEDRVDDEVGLNLGVSRTFTGPLTVSLNYQYVNVRSTFDIYTYDRSIFSVSSSKEF
jgi:tetratricopeptide (TPR) repeat protein